VWREAERSEADRRGGLAVGVLEARLEEIAEAMAGASWDA
jgi:hypothetical protein